MATSSAAPTPPVPPLTNAEDWHGLVARLDLGGVASELAHNCELVSWDGQCLRLTLDRGTERLRVAAAEERLRATLARLLGDDCRLDIQVARPEGETPSRRRAREGRERQRAAEEALAADLVTQALTTTFGARLIPGTVRPTG
jgi:DNA polymerase-3 subunit gamma/tau